MGLCGRFIGLNGTQLRLVGLGRDQSLQVNWGSVEIGGSFFWLSGGHWGSVRLSEGQ